MLQIPPITNLALTDKTMMVVLQALIKLPYEVAQPAIAEIEAQIAKQQPAAPPPGGEQAPAAPKNPKVSKAVKAAIKGADNVHTITGRGAAGDSGRSSAEGKAAG